MQEAPGADESMSCVAVMGILPDVYMPTPLRETGQKVLSRLMWWDSELSGALVSNKDIGGKGESGGLKGRLGPCSPRDPSSSKG